LAKVAALLSAATVLVAGCSSSGTGAAAQANSTGKVTLSFWSWVPGIDKAVDLWNSTHPDIQVSLDEIPAGSSGGYAKIRAALQAGNAPDLAQIEYQEIPGFLMGNGLVDLSKYGANADKSQFVSWQWNQVSYQGDAYAIPQASGPMGLFYRKDVFTKLGLTPPTTWAQFAQDAAAIHKANPNDYICTMPPGNSAWFTALAWQAGAQWFGTSGDDWTVNIDSPTTLQVAAFWDKLRSEGLIKTEPDFSNGWYKDLQDGNIVAWPSAQWGDAIIEDNAPNTKGDWAVAPMPQWSAGQNISANWGGSSTAVLQGSKHVAQALEFADWLNTNPQSINLLLAGGYGWPAAVGAFQNSSLNQPDPFFGGQNINAVFAKSDDEVNESWVWTPTIDQTYEDLDNGFEAAVAGHGSFVSAVNAAQSQAISELTAKGLQAKAGG
jgi:multiple sugar transport system substrate-binding protein